MKLLNYGLILVLVFNAVSCSSYQDLKLPLKKKEYEEKLNNRFTGFGFDRFR